jgi:hypothetical protein
MKISLKEKSATVQKYLEILKGVATNRLREPLV